MLVWMMKRGDKVSNESKETKIKFSIVIILIIGIVILIEETIQYKNLDDVALRYQMPKWKSNSFTRIDGKLVCRHRKGQPMGQFNIETLVKAMKTMQQKYAVIFAFTTPEKCGEVIIDILVNNRESISNYFSNKLKEINKK